MNFVQLQQDYDSQYPSAKWFVPEDQSDLSLSNFICQSPKIPKSLSTTITTPMPPPESTTTSPDGRTCMQGYVDIVSSSSKCYAILTASDDTTWDEAMSICDSMMNWDYSLDYSSYNTQLVSIDSYEENNKLFDKLTYFNIQSAWIGLVWTGKWMQ